MWPQSFKPIGILLLSLIFLVPAFQPTPAQFAFDSGSTGADGALNLDVSVCTAPDTPTTVDVTANAGVMHYTSIFIHANCLVTFTPSGNGLNRRSWPVRLLASGDVVIDGTLDLDGSPGVDGVANIQVDGGNGGPGGFDGGKSAPGVNTAGWKGFGPGGGNGGAVGVNYGRGTGGSLVPYYSAGAPQPLVGGGGGGGGSPEVAVNPAGGGGGGGGALLIASSGTITLDGTVTARGGNGAVGTSNVYHGGGGSGGMAHFIANAIAGVGTIVLSGGSTSSTNGGAGLAILETTDNQSAFTINAGNTYRPAFQQLTLDLTAEPYLSIASIGAVAPTAGGVQLGVSGTAEVIVTASPGLEGKFVTIRSTGENRLASEVIVQISAGTATGTVTIYDGVSQVSAWVNP